MATVALIGGTGAEFFPQDSVADDALLETKWGSPSAALLRWQQESHDVLFLARHGAAGVIPPHRVNYRANIDLLASQRADYVVALNAVGGIAAEAAPGQLVIPDQLIDYTWGREHTFYDGSNDELDHVEFTEPLDPELRGRIAAASQAPGCAVHVGVSCVTQGPRLETAAAINRFERSGWTRAARTGLPDAAWAL